MSVKRVRVDDLREMKAQGRKIAVLTAYDYPFARLFDRAGIDVLLVGDSLGMVVLGYDTTLPVTMEQILHHTQSVARGVRRALVVADMPFLSFQVDRAHALANAGRLLKEGGAHAVKLEGGRPVAETVRAMVEIGIPVMGHLGLTPQSVHQLGGMKIQARTREAARALVEDARALEEAGAFALVLECVPAEVAGEVTAALSIPTIGIGAGPHCDGQVLVMHDMLGLFERFQPRFAKRYAELAGLVGEAVQAYADEVRAGVFPGPEHTYTDGALAGAAGASKDAAAGNPEEV